MSEFYAFAKEVGVPAVLALAGAWMVYKLHVWHRVERKEWRDEHSAEREAWNVSNEKMQGRNIAAINELSEMIKESNSRRREGDRQETPNASQAKQV